MKVFKEKAIGCEIYYPLPLQLQECFSALAYHPSAFPEAERATGDVLAIPVYGELTPGMLGYVADPSPESADRAGWRWRRP